MAGKKKKKIFPLIWLCVVVILLIGAVATRPSGGEEAVLSDVVAQESGTIQLFGVLPIDPSVIWFFVITVILLIAAMFIRLFAVPKFRYVPGKLQLLVEQLTKILGVLTKRSVLIWLSIVAVFLVASVGTMPVGGEEESIKEVMRDAVLHEGDRIGLFGTILVNPSMVSAFIVSGVLLVAAILIRVFAIPRFQYVPGKLQLALEQVVDLFDSLAKSNSPHRNKFLGAYIFGAGCYIFVGTLFELFGFQAVTAGGASITLPAPLSDINAAIAMGCLSYLIILSGGIAGNKLRGVGNTLKEFSLPISMSFRLFGALLSGLLVTELVYYYISLSFVLPVVVAVLFTLLHALIQTYVLTLLTALFYGEVSHPHEKKPKKKKLKKTRKRAA